MNHTEKTIPVWKKYSLNISEAAEYYGIGEKRLRQIVGENEGADFILEVGSHIRFKRKLFSLLFLLFCYLNCTGCIQIIFK